MKFTFAIAPGMEVEVVENNALVPNTILIINDCPAKGHPNALPCPVPYCGRVVRGKHISLLKLEDA